MPFSVLVVYYIAFLLNHSRNCAEAKRSLLLNKNLSSSSPRSGFIYKVSFVVVVSAEFEVKHFFFQAFPVTNKHFVCYNASYPALQEYLKSVYIARIQIEKFVFRKKAISGLKEFFSSIKFKFTLN